MSNTSIIKSPLFIILASATLLFVAYVQLNNYMNKDDYVIYVTNSEIEELALTWESRMGRAATQEELNGLIEKNISDEVMYRTALEMGLDKDDRVIKGRMIQKLRFLGNDLIRPVQPSEQDLVKFYQENEDLFVPEEVITITHVFFDPDKRDDTTLEDAEKALKTLESRGEFNGSVSGLGDPFMLQNYYPNRSQLEIRKLFGNGFTESVFEIEERKWTGPVLSGYGVHLVYVHDLQPAELPPFEMVREQVKEVWMEDMQKKLNDKYMEGVMARYSILYESDENK